MDSRVVMTAEPPPDNRRASPRRRSLKAGRIIFGNMALSYDCTIRDMSDTGARLKIDANLNVPGEFYLYIPGDYLIARAKLVWRSPKEIGILYLEPLRNLREHPDPRVAKMVVY